MKLSEASAIPVPFSPGRLYLPNVPARLGQAQGEGQAKALLLPLTVYALIFGGAVFILSRGPSNRPVPKPVRARTSIFPAGTTRSASGSSALFPTRSATVMRGSRPNRRVGPRLPYR